MKLHRLSGERRGRARAVDVAWPVEAIENPYADLERLLSNEVRQKFIDQIQSLMDVEEDREGDRTSVLFSDLIATTLLDQVLRLPLLPIEMREKIKGFARSPNELLRRLPRRKKISKRYSWWEFAQAKIIFPSEAHVIQTTDQEFQQGVDYLRQQPDLIAQRAGMNDSEIADTITFLAILRPDQKSTLLFLLNDPNIADHYLGVLKDPVFGNLSSCIAAAARLLDPTYELTPAQKKKLVASYAEVMDDEMLCPSLSGLAQLAVLLAPKVTLTDQGQIVLSKQTSAMRSDTALPDRSM